MLRVLVVDDNVEIASLLQQLLIELGHAAEICHHGEDALVLAASFAPDVALIDIGLPEMDGYQLAGKLRASPTPPTVFAMSGRPPDDRRARDAGIAGCLLKPIGVETLTELLATLGKP